MNLTNKDPRRWEASPSWPFSSYSQLCSLSLPWYLSSSSPTKHGARKLTRLSLPAVSVPTIQSCHGPQRHGWKLCWICQWLTRGGTTKSKTMWGIWRPGGGCWYRSFLWTWSRLALRWRHGWNSEEMLVSRWKIELGSGLRVAVDVHHGGAKERWLVVVLRPQAVDSHLRGGTIF